MPRVNYLGSRADFGRAQGGLPVEPTARVVPELVIADPNAEPLIVAVNIPDYSADHLPLREVRLIALPTGVEVPTADDIVAGFDGYTHKAVVDTTNIKGQSLDMSLAGLPDGSWYVLSVLTAGVD